MGLLGSGVVPGRRQSRKCSAYGSRSSRGATLPRRIVMLPSPPHCATSRPPGRSAASQAAKEKIVVGDPVERRGRDDRVELLVEIQLEQVDDADVRCLTESLLGRVCTIEADWSTAITRPRGSRSISAWVMRPEPQPASSTSSSPVSSRRDEHLEPERLHRPGDAVVAGAIPGADLRHTSVRYHVYFECPLQATAQTAGCRGRPQLALPACRDPIRRRRESRPTAPAAACLLRAAPSPPAHACKASARRPPR